LEDKASADEVLECARKAGTLVYGESAADGAVEGSAVWTSAPGVFLDARFQHRTIVLAQTLEIRNMHIAQVCCHSVLVVFSVL
jgi:hypothetical protein